MELKNNPGLLAKLEKEEGNTNYWIKNYPKIKQLLSSKIELNNAQETDKEYIFENGVIKKLLQVSPSLQQQDLPLQQQQQDLPSQQQQQDLPSQQQQQLPSKYFKLREFLAAKNWKEADEETSKVMLQVAGREKKGWLRVEDIEQFPCEDLHIIDQLWVEYSDRKFGFSIQKEIYHSLGGKREYNREVWKNFGKEVGWYKRGNKSWIVMNYNYISDENGKIVTPYEGHLPWGWGWRVGELGRGLGELGWLGGISFLAQRLVECNI